MTSAGLSRRQNASHRPYQNAGYFYRPSFLIARFAQPRNGYRVVIPAWQLSLSVDPAQEIGRVMVRMGVYDLPVSETIWRLLDPGDYAIDVGASLGHMTSIMAASRQDGAVALRPFSRVEAVGRFARL